MPRLSYILLTLVVGFLAAAVCPLAAEGCVMTINPIRVGSSFRVRVSDRSHSVRALELELSPFGSHPTGTGVMAHRVEVTDDQGYALFSKVPSGSYTVRASHDPLGIDVLYVDVISTAPAIKTLSLTWPRALTASVQSAAGTLRSTNFYPQQSQDQFSMSLIEGRTGRVIETTMTDKTGRFAFDNVLTPGVYFISIAERPLVDGSFAIEINRRAKNDRMDLYVSSSDCGLTFSCRQPAPEINEREVCGDVTDTMGAAVAGADVWLFSNDGDLRVIESTKTDSSGHFALTERKDGTYKLAVQRSGFVPYTAVVHLRSGAISEACAKPLRIKLSI